MDNDIIGYVGTGVLAITLAPQVYKTFMSRKANDLSWISLFLQIIANILFIFYGIGIGSIPVVISNSMVLLMSISLMCAKYIFTIENENSPLISFTPI